mmetsp:Transcript_101791/g.287118  ORF Transcript_101791/g.287118 Transcript_101791/m.287118 type:complete len:431 (+) Transcript_101791:176-1468(+)
MRLDTTAPGSALAPRQSNFRHARYFDRNSSKPARSSGVKCCSMSDQPSKTSLMGQLGSKWKKVFFTEQTNPIDVATLLMSSAACASMQSIFSMAQGSTLVPVVMDSLKGARVALHFVGEKPPVKVELVKAACPACSLQSPSRRKLFASSSQQLSFKSPVRSKAQPMLAMSWLLALRMSGAICIAMALKRSGSLYCAIAKAHAVLTKQRNENSFTCCGMYLHAASNNGSAQRHASVSTAPSLANAHNVVESSKGLKQTTSLRESVATVRSKSNSAQRSVANDQAMLLKAWLCSVNPATSARRRAAKTVATRYANVWCSLRAACAWCSPAVSFASLCKAVDMFTKFIIDRCASIELNKRRQSPVLDTATIWLLIHANVARFIAWRGRTPCTERCPWLALPADAPTFPLGRFACLLAECMGHTLRSCVMASYA